MISKPHASEMMNNEFGNAAYSMPTTYYVGLSTTPVEYATGLGFTEPSGVGYARASIANATENWELDENGYVKNKTIVEFPLFDTTLAGTNVAYWFIAANAAANAEGDKALYFGQLLDASGAPVEFPIVSGGRVYIPAGNIQLGRTNA